ncbi:MAG: exosortase/archaeosortase family protein [Acidobacteriaceae bacterium]|nr:exosortase/archaeosortase family protein [Acidobacteriaceae bacterium]
MSGKATVFDADVRGPVGGETSSSPASWMPVLWFGGLLAVSYAFVLSRLAQQWFTDDDMSHGMFVPPLVAYIVWQRWTKLRSLPAASNMWGLLLMIAGSLMLCIGPPSLPTFVFMTRVGFVFSLTGLVLFLRGTRTLRELAYPLLLLLFMIPPPGFIYQRLTLPLQFVASFLSENLLELLGYSVLREGNVLHLPGQTLDVVEACSGLRSLLSLSFLAQAYAYLFDRRPWMRVALAIVIIPIAVAANACRIALSAMAGRINPEWGHGLYHAMTAWIVFVVSFVLLLITHQVICRVRGLFYKEETADALS